MRSESFDKFDLGFVSALDIDTHKVPKNALSDCLNLEINRPLMMLSQSLGYDSDSALPSYSGSRTVAFRKWSVDFPSDKELTTLIRVSENMLYYSEDFEIQNGGGFTNGWDWTADSAAVNANFTAGPTRRADRIGGANAGTRLEQSFVGVSGNTYTFSLYAGFIDCQIRITIIDSVGSTSTTLSSGSGFQRISVTRTLASGTGTKVRIDFPNGGGSELADIWGAQLELGSTSTEYGATYDTIKPYYIYLSAQWNGTAWVDGWVNLTEQRAGIASSNVPNVSFRIAFLDGADDYYNNWRVSNIQTLTSTPFYVYDFTSATKTFTTNRDVANGVRVLVSKFMSQHEATQIAQGNLDESHITFVEVYGALRISFGKNIRPLVLQYLVFTGAFTGLPQPVAYNQITMAYTSHIGTGIPSLISATAASGSESAGVSASSLTGVNDASGTLIASTTYYLSLVMVIKGQRFVVSHHSVNTGGGNNAIDFVFQIADGLFNPRTDSIEVYVGSGSQDWEKALYSSSSITDTTLTWARSASQIFFTKRVLSIITTNPSLLQNLGRISDIETRNRFNLQHYLRGHIFTGQSDNALGGSDQVRFSSIQILTEALDVFAYSESEGYGYIVVESGTSEKVVGFGSTRDNDLLVFKERSTHLFEVQSGGITKRLVRIFESIGLSTNRAIAQSDYGTFWYDKNGAYQYIGGVNAPRIVSDGRVTRYFQNVLVSYLPTSFGFFNRKFKEYWIFVQKSGTIGSSSPSDYEVLRYSPEYNNWNLLQFDFVPIWASENLAGELIFVGKTTNVNKYGYSTTLLSSGFAQTHPYSFGNKNPKMLEDIKAIYNTSANLKVSLLLNEESSARSGNALQFLSVRKEMNRRPRQSSRFNRLAIKIEKTGGSVFEVSEVELSIADTVRRYSASH